MRYQLRRVVADGGAGRVYEALDTHRKIRVAVKVLHPEVAQDEVALERFKRELEVSKLLAHPHIVEILDFQPLERGGFALVMEYLEGEELRSVLQREGRLSPARLVRMLSQLALALEEAHRRNLVHRDLKPDNIFLSGTRAGDIAKVLDFGSVRDNSTSAKKLTLAGTTIGSPHYMAPEQAQGLESLDSRADVWALCAVVYECLTGDVPFPGTSGPSILFSILTNEPIPPSARSVEIPSSIDDVIAKGFAKDPSQRIEGVTQFADAIGHAFGLEGDHRVWAHTEESLLAARLGTSPTEALASPERSASASIQLPIAKRPWLIPLAIAVATISSAIVAWTRWAR